MFNSMRSECIGNIEATAAACRGPRGIPASPSLSAGHRAILIALPGEGALADPFVLAGDHGENRAPQLAGQRGLARARLAADEGKSGHGQRARMPSMRQ